MITEWNHKPAPQQDYWQNYIDAVPEGAELVEYMLDQIDDVEEFFTNLPDIKLNYRYRAGKWSPKEILGHLIDTERVLSYRAITFARGDRTELPGFDEQVWVGNSNAETRDLQDLLGEFEAVRRSTVAMLMGLDANMLDRKGVANQREVSVIRIIYALAGHANHHLKVISERYMVEE